MTLSINGLRATAVRRVTPYSGPWSADVDIDLGDKADLTPGPAVIAIADLRLSGAIDPTQSGRKGFLARARVVAGAGGWEKIIPAQHHKNDGGVLSTTAFGAAAALVGERIVELAPGRLGVDFVRWEGPAAAVLDGFEWRVAADGTTIIGPRTSTPAPPSVRVLDWDARTRVATCAADDVLVEPGMILTDGRFGSAKIRDVEQSWTDGGARAIARCVPVDAPPDDHAGGELAALFGAIANSASKDLPTFQYRVRSQAPDGRFTLEKIATADGVPDLKLIALAPAIAGLSVKVPTGTVVHVVFVRAGNRSLPVVVRFDPGAKPISISVASPTTHFGPGAKPKAPVAIAAPVEAKLAALQTAMDLLLTTISAQPFGAAAKAAQTAFDAAMSAAPPVPSTSLTAE